MSINNTVFQFKPKYLNLRNSSFVLFIVSHFVLIVSGYLRAQKKGISDGTKVMNVDYSSQLDLCPFCCTLDILCSLIVERGLKIILISNLDSIISLLIEPKSVTTCTIFLSLNKGKYIHFIKCLNKLLSEKSKINSHPSLCFHIFWTVCSVLAVVPTALN